MEQIMLYWFDKTTIKLNHIVIRYAFLSRVVTRVVRYET